MYFVVKDKSTFFLAISGLEAPEVKPIDDGVIGIKYDSAPLKEIKN